MTLFGNTPTGRAQDRARETGLPAIFFKADGKARCHNPLQATEEQKQEVLSYVRNYNARLRRKGKA